MKARTIIAALFAVLSIAAITITVVIDENGPHATVTATSANGKKVEVPKTVLAPVEANDAGQHDDLSNESMTSPKTLFKNDKKASPKTPRFYGPPPDAAPSWPGCATRTLSTNFSYRTGIRPTLIVLHLTVSSNVFGWADLNAIFVFFNQGATKASSNFVYDAEGRCYYMVSVTAKAWAQAGHNSNTACSYEVVNRGTLGNEPSYIGAGERNLARGVRTCAKVFHIPLRRGIVNGCTVVRSGVVDHDALGSCGGGHVDINPYGSGPSCKRTSVGNTSRCIDRIVAVADHGLKPISTRSKAQCRELHRLRRIADKPGHWTSGERERAGKIKAKFKRYRVRCVKGKATRRV